ncbi:major facilitator superfamily domain-containing protein, partial [Gymnopilus junonius]
MSSFNNPRSSVFWSNAPMVSAYFPNQEDDDEQQEQLLGESEHDGRTPLDKTIDRIGMGSYQWTLLALCGFGWMADNMWLQAIAIILPRIQQHYSVPDSYIGSVSSSMFAGMMLGAVGWGTCSDVIGRSMAFNGTLFFTAVFGILASLSNSFLSLCIALFFLGSSVGGSMPTDGTLLLEQLPKEKQYLVTALSIFFSLGAVVSAAVALLVLPKNSCPAGTTIPCDIEVQNQGWKYLLIILGLITLSMFIARMVFFRLHESPRYLVHAGRPHDAIKSLQLISQFNGSDLSIELEDVRDHLSPMETDTEAQKAAPRMRATSRTVLIEDRQPSPPTTSNAEESSRTSPSYDSTGETQMQGSHSFITPAEGSFPREPAAASAVKEPLVAPTPTEDVHVDQGPARRRLSTASRRSSIYEEKVCRVFPRWVRRPLRAWWDRVLMVLAPEWLRTTVLVWSAWFSMSLAYTMFNVYLPKLLETRSDAGVPQTLEESLWDVMIFTIGGCPGALLGAYLIESSLGRRWSLAGSTFLTGFFCIMFVVVKETWLVRTST